MNEIYLIVKYSLFGNWRKMLKAYGLIAIYALPVILGVFINALDLIDNAELKQDESLIYIRAHNAVEQVHSMGQYFSLIVASAASFLAVVSEQSSGKLTIFFPRISRTKFYLGTWAAIVVLGLLLKLIATGMLLYILIRVKMAITSEMIFGLFYDCLRIVFVSSALFAGGTLLIFPLFRTFVAAFAIYVGMQIFGPYESWFYIPHGLAFLKYFSPADVGGLGVDTPFAISISDKKFPWAATSLAIVDGIIYTGLWIMIGISAVMCLRAPTRSANN